MSLFRIGQIVRIHCENHPRDGYTGRILAEITRDGDSVYRLNTAAGDMLVAQQWLQPDAYMRECDRPAMWNECGWKPKEIR